MSGRQILVERPGGYERLSVVAKPSEPLREGEVRVSVRAVGVNYADVCVRMGVYGAVQRYPICPGFEFSGVVTELGPGVRRVAAGDRVFGVTRFGGYATEQAVSERFLWRVPEGWSFEQAAGFPAVFLTAYHALETLGHARPGMSVLVHSAAGGVGLAAVQLAKLMGCRVVGVVGGAAKVEPCRAAGADAVIDKSSADLWREAERLSSRGYDLVLDANGWSTLRESYDHLAPCGLLLVYGFHSMMPRRGGRVRWLSLARDWLRTPSFDPLKMVPANKGVIGFNVVYLFDRADEFNSAVERMTAWAAEGKLRPPLVATYPFEEAARAHADLESGRTVGKLILSVPA